MRNKVIERFEVLKILLLWILASIGPCWKKNVHVSFSPTSFCRFARSQKPLPFYHANKFAVVPHITHRKWHTMLVINMWNITKTSGIINLGWSSGARLACHWRDTNWGRSLLLNHQPNALMACVYASVRYVAFYVRTRDTTPLFYAASAGRWRVFVRDANGQAE